MPTSSELLTSDAAFGFGQGVTGGSEPIGSQAPRQITVRNAQELMSELAGLSLSDSVNTPTLITLAPGKYNFNGAESTIGVRNLTLQAQPGSRVELRNFGLVLDLHGAHNILIRDLAFHSDGSGNPGDAILFDGTNSLATAISAVRITHCTFDGYKDEAIEIRSRFSALVATIDHCYFVDRKPGQGVYKDRGAINIASVILKGGTRTNANSYVTVAFNYFQDVWRRSPRAAAAGTHAHVFNNLLYRWGYQKTFVDTSSWNGMSIGQLDGQNQATQALIEANRFIPWGRRESLAITRDLGTAVDIGEPSLLNQFDNPEGQQDNNSPLIPAADAAHNFPTTLDFSTGYRATKFTGAQAPTVTGASEFPWKTLVDRAGTLVSDGKPVPPGVSDPASIRRL